jgi:OOP family OmpA-OmpF porin
MNRPSTRAVLAASLLALAIAAHAQQSATPQSTNYGDKPPSVDDIIQGLGDGGTSNAPATRALRPGAAVSANAPLTAPAQPAAPRPASISMQIKFDFNSDAISASSQSTVSNLAQAMKSPELASRQFTIVGHTDGKGSAAYNQALSERRAQSVKRELMRGGVPAERLQATGRGMSQLLNTSDPSAGENRRVEIQAKG